jgi:hypothetical protein
MPMLNYDGPFCVLRCGSQLHFGLMFAMLFVKMFQQKTGKSGSIEGQKGSKFDSPPKAHLGDFQRASIQDQHVDQVEV